uniref:Uncharacterized protein n=1 Tax=Romanomermis culicivorax TaxID=13658 RepID=A0A915JZE6_ROMCU
MGSQRLNQTDMKRKALGDDKPKPDKYQHMDAKSPELKESITSVDLETQLDDEKIKVDVFESEKSLFRTCGKAFDDETDL